MDLTGDYYGGCLEIRTRRVRDALLRLAERGGCAVLLIDDAHAVPADTLYAVREITELCGVFEHVIVPFLIGQPSLSRHYNDVGLEGFFNTALTLPMPEIDAAGYITWAMERAGRQVGDIFTARGLGALCATRETYTAIQRAAMDAMLVAARLRDRVDVDMFEGGQIADTQTAAA